METNSDQSVYNIVSIVCLCLSLLPLVGFFHFLKKPLEDTTWHFNKTKHVVVSATILKCKIYESVFNARGNNTSWSYYGKYCPIITVSYTYNQELYTTDLNLNTKGFYSPESAIIVLYELTDSCDFTFIHTFDDSIYNQFKSFLTDFRISKTTNTKKTIQLKIDPTNPLDNEFNHNLFKYSDYVPTMIMVFFTLALLVLPLILPTVSLTQKIIWFTMAIICAYFIYNTFSSRKKSSKTVVPKFSVIIDKTYDGTQLEPYFKKD